MRGQRRKGAVSVHIHLEFACDHVYDLAVCADDKSRTFHRGKFAEKVALHSEGLGDVTRTIGEQWVIKGVLVRELLLLFDRVRADTDSLSTSVSKLSFEVAKMAALGRAPCRHCGWVEEEHHWAIGQ